MKYLYYSGCSLKGSAIDYEESFYAVASVLGLEIEEMTDWKCCGATTIKSIDKELYEKLVKENILKILKSDTKLIMLCPLCYLNHFSIFFKVISENNLNFEKPIKITHILELLYEYIDKKELNEKIIYKLHGIKVLPFYGCLWTRPLRLLDRQSYENPQIMEIILKSIGAEPVDFNYKVDCCGGPLLITNENLAVKLATNIFSEIQINSIDCIAVACPLCHFMLDAKQKLIEKKLNKKFNIPVLYITQLVGIAFGIEGKKLGLNRLINQSKSLLQKIIKS